MNLLPLMQLVETKMRRFKLLGERVMARDIDRQVDDFSYVPPPAITSPNSAPDNGGDGITTLRKRDTTLSVMQQSRRINRNSNHYISEEN